MLPASPHPTMNTPVSMLLDRKDSQTVLALPPSATVAKAVRLMNRHRLGSVLVASARHVVGIFTERDVLTRVVGAGRDPATTTLFEVMTREPRTILPSTTVAEAMEIITVRRLRRLPVLDEYGVVVGLVTIGDLLRYLVEAHQAEAASLRDCLAGGAAS
jgi:CBS domain-containing protein